MVVDPLGDTPTLEMGSELVAVGGVGRLDQPAGDVGGEAGGEHDGGAQVELVVDHHPLELLRTGATKPGTVPTGGLGARDVALADQPEQRQLRLAQGAGTEAIAEEAPHRTEDVAVEPPLQARRRDDAARAQHGEVECPPVVADQESPRLEPGQDGIEKGSLFSRIGE